MTYILNIKITVNSLSDCVISPKYPELDKYLRYNLRIVRKGYEYIEECNDYIKYIDFYDEKKSSFGYGFLGRVKFIISEFMKKKVSSVKYKIEVIDKRPVCSLKNKLPDKLIGIKLRPYQEKCVNILEKKLSGVCKSYPGSGKTVMMAELIRRKNLPTLVITSGKKLVEQDRDNLSKFLGMEVGLIKGKECSIKSVTIASSHTLVKNIKKYMKYFNRVQCLVVDECHHASSKSYQTILSNINNARYVYGFSATPETSYYPYKSYVNKYCGSICVNVPADFLIKNGYLSKPFMYFIDLPEGDWSEQLMDYNQVYDSYILNNDFRNGLICKLIQMLKYKGLVLVLTDRVDHVMRLDAMLKYTDIKYKIQSGKFTSDKERTENLSLMRNNELDIVISTTGIMGEGIDIPNVKVLIIAGSGKAYVQKNQEVGRGLRLFGDNKVDIVTFVNNDRSTKKCLKLHSNKFLKMMKKNNEFMIKVVNHSEIDDVFAGIRSNQRTLGEYGKK